MVDEALRDAKQHMDASIGSVTNEFNTLRTGRASISILDDIVVDYYGAPTPLNQLANITAPDARLIVVSPYDKGASAAIEKAILASQLGVTPSNDGSVIFVVNDDRSLQGLRIRFDPRGEGGIIGKVRKVGRVLELVFTAAQQRGYRDIKQASHVYDSACIRCYFKVFNDSRFNTGLLDQFQGLARF